MKKTVLLFYVFSLWAETDWVSSLQEAKKLASSENKHIIVMLSKEECDACWYMKHIVFENTNVKLLMQKSFIGVVLDVEVEEIPSKFHYIGTPTFYFIDKEGNELGHRLNGAANVKDFTLKVNQILGQNKN